MSESILPNQVLNNFSNSKPLRLPTHLYKASKDYLKPKDINKIQKAYTFAYYAHDGQTRKDGSAYVSHPIEVAKILADLKMDPDTICSALLHDVLEDCGVQKNSLLQIFGKDVANIVDGVSKLGKIEMQDKAERDANNFQKMALAMAKDIRVVLVKLCDRLHNMRTIEWMPRHKQIIKSKETLEMYGPLALRVGMESIRSELEELAFKCIHPLRAKMIESAVLKSSGGRKKIVTKIRKELKSHLKQNNIEGAAVKGREKGVYSIYKKIKTKRKPFSEILDVYGFRILVDSVDDCYRALGIIHNYFKPIENRFKDYIAIPKSNGYQALHTSLLALNAFPIEVQVQTRSMFNSANIGIAAHWGYKTSESSTGLDIKATKWLSSIVDIHKRSDSSSEFVESIKTDLDPNEVYLFSPKGNIFPLKVGATPIDFAYEVHTDLGEKIVGCRVNRKEVPLNIELETGQTVEIITSDTPPPADPSWLNFVVTSKARKGITALLRNQKISAARKAGKFLLESELKRTGHDLNEFRGSSLKRILKSIGTPSLDKLLVDLGLGKKTGNIIAERFYSGLKIRKIEEDNNVDPLKIDDNHIEGVPIVFARCCHPIFGDQVITHSDTERGLVIHNKQCKQIEKRIGRDPRLLETIWLDTNRKHEYIACINVITENRVGVLADMLSIFTKEGINVVNLNTKEIDKRFTGFLIELEVSDKDYLSSIMAKIRAKKFTSSCKRVINKQ